MLRPRRAACALIGGVLLALGPAGPAAAHTGLVSSEPAAGATVASAPTSMRLTFAEPVEPGLAAAAVSVGGAPPSPAATTVSGSDVVVAVPAPGAGPPPSAPSWEVSYRVVSRDGHPVTGTVDFTVAPGPSPARGSAEATAAVRSEDAETPAAPSTGPAPVEAGPGTSAAGTAVRGDERVQADGPPGAVAVGGVAAAGVAAALLLVRKRRAS